MTINLHVELPGRRSQRPTRWRMLDYIGQLVLQDGLPLHSVVISTERGAGGDDTGRHEHKHPDGGVVLAGTYQVVHLWGMTAEELVAVGRTSLLPLTALATYERPVETVPRIIAAIRAEPDQERQAELLGQWFGLLRDEEIIAMTRNLLTAEDLEDIREHPFLWRMYQEGQEEGRREVRRLTRAHILDALVARFDPRCPSTGAWSRRSSRSTIPSA